MTDRVQTLLEALKQALKQSIEDSKQRPLKKAAKIERYGKRRGGKN